MPRLSLRGAGSTMRRSHRRRAIGVYEDEEDELEVVPGLKGHSVDNATYVSVSEGVFKRVDIGAEDGSTGTKAKKVTIMETDTTAHQAGSTSSTSAEDAGYVTSLMKWLALDDSSPQSSDNVETIRIYHGMEPYEEPKPVKTIKPPTARPARPSSPIPAMRQASRPRPTLSPDQLGRASSPRRPVSPAPRPLSPAKWNESQNPVSPQLRRPSVSADEVTKSKASVSGSEAFRCSSNRPTRAPPVDLTSKRKKKTKVKRSPVVPVQSNRIRSSHRPFDHPSKSPAVFNQYKQVRVPIHVVKPTPKEDMKRLAPDAPTTAVGKDSFEANPPASSSSSSSKEVAPAPNEVLLARQGTLPGVIDVAHDSDYGRQNAIEEIEANERADSSRMLCFCQPETLKNQEEREETVVAETTEGSMSGGTNADSLVRPKQSFLATFLNCPSLCLTDLDDREDHRDDEDSKEGEEESLPAPSPLKNIGGGDSTTTSSISLGRTVTSTSTGTAESSSVGNETTSYDDGTLSDSDDSTVPARGKKKSYKLTVTFEPPTWLA